MATASAIEDSGNSTAGDAGGSSNVTLTCRVEAIPAPSVGWSWQGHTIKNGSLAAVGSAMFVIKEISGDRWATSNLTVLRADMEHGGEYVCVGRNSAGTRLIKVAKRRINSITRTF